MIAELPVLAIVLPIVGAIACVIAPRAIRFTLAIVGPATTVASLALAADVHEHGVREYAVGGWAPPLGIALHVDGLAAALVALTAVVMTACGLHARVRRAPDMFAASWFFTWAALAVVFLTDDVFNVYVALELLGIAAVALVAAPGTPAALQAAFRYLAAGLTGSLLYLLGVALLFAETGTLSMSALAGTSGPPAWAALAFMSAGLVLKSAVFPLHGWLPGAHGSAPAAASAVLSGVVVKAGVYLLWRLWGDVLPGAATDAGAVTLGVLGTGALLWGSMMALRAQRLKLVVAYSTVAQLGYLVIAVPILRAGGTEVLSAAALLLAAHALAKAGCFLAAGAVITARHGDALDTLRGLVSTMPIATFTLALGAVSLIGLPPTGGFAAKWLLVQSTLQAGAWWWAVTLVGGSLLSAAVFVRALGGGFETGPDTPGPALARPGTGGVEWTALGFALAALAAGPLCAPWLDLVTTGAGR
jgi:formate hydrogenlyase subunit 3/multisubunit Na+/H+ antiporter MnhD subunit